MNSLRNLIKINGIDVSWIELGRAGKGDDVIILHGSFCNADIMREYAEKFAKGNHVILIDLPGHFVSEPQMFSDFDALTNCIVEIIKTFRKLNIIAKKPILHGWSLAGSLVLNIAASEPQLLKEGVVLDGDSEWINKVIPPFISSEQLIGTFKGLLSTPSVGVSQETVAQLIEKSEHCLCNWQVANADLTMDFSLNITDKLDKIVIPISIIFGEFDFLSSVERQKILASSIKNAKLHIIPGGMHQICIEKPAYIHDLLERSALEEN